MQGFREENLGGGVKALLSESHGFGTDALLLACFANPSASSVSCDLGTGCGIIPLLWCRGRCGEITAVELQEQGCEQLRGAIELSSLEGRVKVVNADLRELKGIVPFGAFDLVTMNPPYKAHGAGLQNADEARRIARHAVMCSMGDICAAAAKLLKFGGRFCVCIRPERLSEVFSEMQKAGIEPKRMRTVSKCLSRAPWLVLIEARRGGRTGMVIDPPLYIYDDLGGYSAEVMAMYGEYAIKKGEGQ